MCVVIESRSVLANILLQINRATIESMRRFRKEVKTHVPDVYVEISSNSIYRAVINNPGMFALEEDDVVVAPDFRASMEPDFIDATVNRNYPDEVKKALKQARASL